MDGGRNIADFATVGGVGAIARRITASAAKAGNGKGNEMRVNMQTEPVAIIAAIIGLIEAGIALLPLFGVPLTVEQQAGLMGFVVAAGSVASAIWARSLVTPVANPQDNDGNPLKADQVMVP